MNYSGYNPQQQQQQQQQHSYEYDPASSSSSSQIQIQQAYEYDQSYAAAAAAYQQQPYYAYNQQYAAAYYPADLSQLHYHQSEQPSPLHPPGVNPTEQPLPLPTINHLPIGSSQYRGRGGRSFKRGGRGGASYHGRGRGVGGGRHFRSHSAVPAAAGASFLAQSSSPISGQTLPKPGRVQTAPVQPRMVYCEICKVECNTPEIMEQHKNGKKHKKNVIVHEKMQRYNAINGQQNEQVPTPQLNPTDQPMNVQEFEEKNSPAKNVGSEITADNQKDEIKLQNNVGETSEVPPEMPEGVTMENTAAIGRGLKRKARGGKGRKHLRTADGSKLVQVSKPEQAVFTCELCNVKCESQVVYQSHVTGKKHLKRAHGHQAPSGIGNETSSGVGHQALPAAVGLQTIYPPDINALANAINAQVQQGDNDPQVLLAQLLVNVLSQAQGSATAPLNGPVAAQTPTPTSVAGSSYQPLLAQTQVSEITEHVGTGNPAEGSRNEILSVPLESNNAHEGSSVSTQIEGGSSETK